MVSDYYCRNITISECEIHFPSLRNTKLFKAYYTNRNRQPRLLRFGRSRPCKFIYLYCNKSCNLFCFSRWSRIYASERQVARWRSAYVTEPHSRGVGCLSFYRHVPLHIVYTGSSAPPATRSRIFSSLRLINFSTSIQPTLPENYYLNVWFGIRPTPSHKRRLIC